MTPLAPTSRYAFCSIVEDEAGRWFLTERTPYRYVDHPDNRTHVLVQGDSLWSLAAHYFAPLPRPAGFWWAIADFQPDPVFDPTIALRVGSQVVIPSRRVLTDVILAQPRRRVLS